MPQHFWFSGHFKGHGVGRSAAMAPPGSFCTGELPALKERPIHQTSKWENLRNWRYRYCMVLHDTAGISWNDMCESACGSVGLKQALFPLASLAFGRNALMDKARKRWLSQLLKTIACGYNKRLQVCQQALNYLELVWGPNTKCGYHRVSSPSGFHIVPTTILDM